MIAEPIPDRAAAASLGAALRQVGYTENSVLRLLGDDAYDVDLEDVPVAERRLPDTRLATAIRILFLGITMSKRDAVRAFGARAVDALEGTGLATVGRDVIPRARVLPIRDLLIANDGYSTGAEDPPDWVAGYTPTSRLCDSLTPRPQVTRALDVGSGSGVHALLAATHADHVVATDVNPRALAYTELNAALNGFTNIECRRGSLFEPVEGEQFDLITCNAPYVVSPENRWAYRDSGLEGDALSERVLEEGSAHLAEGGFATLLVSWLSDDEDAPDERVLSWALDTNCDSWIFATVDADPIDHAAEWNSHLADDPDAFGAALDEWVRYLEQLGARRVTEGAVLLHRRPGGKHRARVDLVDEEELDEASDQILRAFAARERLASLSRSADLLDATVAPAMAMRIERDVEPRRGGLRVAGAGIRLLEGTNSDVEATPYAVEVVASLERKAVRDVVADVGGRLELSEAEAARAQREAVAVIWELLELGALELR